MAQDTSLPTVAPPVARRRPWLTQDRREELTAYLFIAPWLIGFLIFTLGAMIFSLWLSFLDTDLLSKSQFVGPNNYIALFNDKLFIQSLKVTTLYTVLTVPLSTVIALLIALMLNQKIVLPGVFRVIYYLPALVTGVAVTILWGWVLNPDSGLLNGFLVSVGVPRANLPRWFLSEQWALPSLVLMSLWGAGANMLLYLAGLQSVPTQLYEAARIDGANNWQQFWNVTLPMLTPTIFFNLVLNVIGSYQVFTQAYLLTNGGPNNATLTMVLYLFRKSFQQFYFGYASAIAWVLFLIILVFTLSVVRSSDAWVYYEGNRR
ncbi:MAG: sugar ABC transporter permease [Chloroflexales bacterium]|nr:sugar ABC transporter permease [Chloroflexales bacterium]